VFGSHRLSFTTYPSAAAFLAANQAYLEREEVVNALPLGLALRLAAAKVPVEPTPYFAAAADSHGPSLTAVMTPPYRVTVYSDRSEPGEALERLAHDMIHGGWPVPGAFGRTPLPEQFAGIWTRLTGQVARVERWQGVYVLTRVYSPTNPGGYLRPATLADLDPLVGWTQAFYLEALGENQQDEVRRAVMARVAGGELYVWDHNGPAAMAGTTRPLRHGITLTFVYTPPERRGRGYASACVATLSQRQLDAGYQFCTLFTDLKNRTSNHIYQEIGYRWVCEFHELHFAD
jgi:GNAT superfamily N-acetyltransferase